MQTSAPLLNERKCPRCGAVYLRADECPALCGPAPVPPPKYRGPRMIGQSHMSRLAAPVYKPEDWIG
jgi:hypothetical protein